MDVPLFVYGTLKRGFPAHERWCGKATAANPARCPGSLFLHPDGYPVLVVRPESVLALGSADPARDALLASTATTDALRTERRGARDVLARLDAEDAHDDGTGVVSGEVLIVPTALLPLREIDSYEGYQPGMASLFVRVLLQIATQPGPEPVRAWTYAAGRLLEGTPLTPLPGGIWPPPA